MKRAFIAAALVAVATPAFAGGGSSQAQAGQQSGKQQGQLSSQDQQQLKQLEQQRQSALKSNDSDAVSDLYTHDATAQNAQGSKARGQQQIKQQAQRDAQQLQNAAVVTNVIAVDPIDQDTALIESERKITSVQHPELSATVRAVSLAEKVGNEWKLVATREFATVPVAVISQPRQQTGTGGSGSQSSGGQQQQPGNVGGGSAQ